MDSWPLHKGLRDTNTLYRHHRPPQASVCPVLPAATADDTDLLLLLSQSPDGLPLSVQVLLWSEVETQITWQLRMATDGGGPALVWSDDVALMAGWNVLSQQIAEPDPEYTQLLVSFVGLLAGTYFPAHVLAWPTPEDAPTHRRPSGFFPYDDSLLKTVIDRAPVNVEMLNRCRRNSVAVLSSRRQCILGWGDPTTMYAGHPTVGLPADGWKRIGFARAHFPDQTTAHCVFSAVGYTDSADMAARLRIRIVGQADLLLDADGSEQHGDVVVALDGSPTAGVDIELAIRCENSDHHTALLAAAGWWLPEFAEATITGGSPNPPAQSQLLQAACLSASTAAYKPYAQPALPVDDLFLPRQIAAIFGPGQARVRLVAATGIASPGGNNDGSSLALEPFDAPNTVYLSRPNGGLQYLDQDGVAAVSTAVGSGVQADAAEDADRMLLLPGPANVARVTTLQVDFTHGIGLAYGNGATLPDPP